MREFLRVFCFFVGGVGGFGLLIGFRSFRLFVCSCSLSWLVGLCLWFVFEMICFNDVGCWVWGWVCWVVIGFWEICVSVFWVVSWVSVCCVLLGCVIWLVFMCLLLILVWRCDRWWSLLCWYWVLVVGVGWEWLGLSEWRGCRFWWGWSWSVVCCIVCWSVCCFCCLDCCCCLWCWIVGLDEVFMLCWRCSWF